MWHLDVSLPPCRWAGVSGAHLGGLLDDAVPHLVGQQHVLPYQVLLHRLVRLGPDHLAHRPLELCHLKTHMGTIQHGAYLRGRVKS